MSTFYAMREAFAVVQEEGLSSMWQRHTELHHALWDGLRSMGLHPYVAKDEDRLITVNTIKARAPPRSHTHSHPPPRGRRGAHVDWAHPGLRWA